MEVKKNDSYELISREKVKNTPFEIITNNETGKSFGTFGMYKITDEKDDIKEVRKELSKITWEKIIMVIALINEMLKNQIQ